MTTLRSILTFYKSFAFTSLLLTVICLKIVVTYGISTFQALFWFKIISLGLIFYYINSYKKNELYYYKNLGISKLKLWLPILIFDFFFFFITMIITAQTIHDTLPGS